MMISLLIIFSVSFLPILIHSSVPFVINPDCDRQECKEFKQGEGALYYANHLVGDNKIHMIYSSFDELTIMIMQTGKSDTVKFNYDAIFSKNYTYAFQFDDGDTRPVNSFTFILRRLIEFNDTGDTGMMDENDHTMNSYLLTNLTLTNLNFTTNNNTIQPSFEYQLHELNGTLKIDIVYPGEATRDTNFPRLRTEPSSYFLNIALQATNFSSTHPRFALELYVISPAIENPTLSSSRYIDDQYTPGIFNVWQMKASEKSLYPSSMLWKPVVYLSEERTIEDNTLMQIYQIKNQITLDENIDQGIYYSIFAKPNVSAFNVSLGATTDGFFSKANYGFIQFTVGLDSLKPDATIGFVIVGLIVSFGLPIIVAIIAVIFVFKRRLSKQSSNGYNAING